MNYESTKRQILLKPKDIRFKGSRKDQNYIHKEEEKVNPSENKGTECS